MFGRGEYRPGVMNLSFLLLPSTDPIFFLFSYRLKGFSPLLTVTRCSRKSGFGVWLIGTKIERPFTTNRDRWRRNFHHPSTDPIQAKASRRPPICRRPRSSPTVATTSDSRVRDVVTRPIGTSSLIGRCTIWAISTCGVRAISSSSIRSITAPSVASPSTTTSVI